MSAQEQAATVTLEMGLSRTTATVGDPVIVTYTVRRPQGVDIVSFNPGASLEALTLLGQTEGVPRTLEDGRIEEVRTITVAAYETGRKEIPAATLVYRDAEGKEGQLQSKAAGFEVASVLAAGERDPADIKPQAQMPLATPWLWILLATVLLLAAVAFLWWRRRRPRPEAAPVAEIPIPPRPAHEVAYAELERLLSSGLLEKGAVKEFYIELAEILRRYLGRRFGIETFERTSREIVEELGAVRAGVRTTAQAAEFMQACDLVKFARHHPGAEETRRTVESAYRLVDETKQVAAAPAPGPGAAGSQEPRLAAGGSPT